MEGIDGVSSVAVSGQQIEEVILTFDKEKLAANNLDENTVKQIVKGSDMTMPLGLFQFTDEEQSVVIDGNITTVEDLENMLIPVMPTSIPGQGGMDSSLHHLANKVQNSNCLQSNWVKSQQLNMSEKLNPFQERTVKKPLLFKL